MSEWQAATLEEIASPGRYAVVGGPFGSALGRKDYVDDGVPVIRGGQLGGPGWFSHDDLVYVTDDKADRHPGNLAYPGDVLVTQRGTVGQVGIIPVDAPFERYLLSQSQMKLTVDPSRANARFVYYWLLSPEAQHAMVGSTISAGVPHINLATFKGMKIPLPSLLEQERIAGILGSIDDLIENNRRRVEVLEEMARAIYREWFVHFRYPGHEDVPLVDSPLGPIPEGWDATELGRVATVNGATRKPENIEVVKYLDISCLGDRTIEPPSTLIGAEAPGRARRVVGAGDVVWSMVRPNRRAHALLVDPGKDWIASTGLAVLSPVDVSTAFLFESVSTTEFSDYLVSQEGGAAYPAVKPRDFERAPFLHPAADIEGLFTEAVAPIHRLIWTLRAESERLCSIRDLLLPRLVTGQIDVSSLDLDLLEAAG